MLTIYGYLPEVQKCINCDSAKRLCTAKGKEFDFKSLADEKGADGPIFNDNLNELLKLLNKKTAVGISLPVIFDGDTKVGGFAELRMHLAKK